MTPGNPPKSNLHSNLLESVSKIASLRSVHVAFSGFYTGEGELRRSQLALVKIPAPPFGEQERGKWLEEKFIALGLDQVHRDSVGNVFGIYRKPARGEPGPERYIALSAHIDTVFPSGTKIDPVERDGKMFAPGISDNGAGVASLIAIAGALRTAKIPVATDILFIGNVGEEGEGDLRGMRHLFADPKWRSFISEIIVVDGTGGDGLVTQALGSKRFDVAIHGPGGHSWSDHGIPNPIVLLSRAIVEFSGTPMPREPKTTTNVGVISGGTSVNSIPESAQIRVDIRSTSTEEIDRLEQALHTALKNAVEGDTKAKSAKSKTSGITYHVKLIGNRPAAILPRDSRILQTLSLVDSHLGILSRERIASTDANIPLSLGIDAISVGGGGDGGGAHTVNEWFDPAHRDLALKRILLSVLMLAGVS